MNENALPVPPGAMLSPQCSTRPMREVFRILKTLTRTSFVTGGDALEFELELNRLAVVLPAIPKERARLHWVNRWGVSLKKDGEPLPPVSCATYFLENCQFPQACSRWMDFSFLPWNEPSISSLHPHTPVKTPLEWALHRLCDWGREAFLNRPKDALFDGLMREENGKVSREVHVLLHENLLLLIGNHLRDHPEHIPRALAIMQECDQHWWPEFCANIESHPDTTSTLISAFDFHITNRGVAANDDTTNDDTTNDDTRESPLRSQLVV